MSSLCRLRDEEPSVKKGRHRRYEEARKFQRDNAAAFSVENFDFDAPDPFSIRDRESGSFNDASEEATEDMTDEASDIDELDEADDYSELAAKYADFEPTSNKNADAN